MPKCVNYDSNGCEIINESRGIAYIKCSKRCLGNPANREVTGNAGHEIIG